jgi:uncharacterized protein (UPF0276 family)
MVEKPVIGFGLDAQYAHRYPMGMEGLCRHYHDRLSHLSIVSLLQEEQAERFKRDCAFGLPVVHHLPGIAPADPDGPHLDRFSRLDRVSDVLNACWACEDIAIWSIGPYAIPYFTPPIFEAEIADKIAEGIVAMQAMSRTPFIAEVPSCAFVAGRMPLGAFFHRIVEQTGCNILCDVSHVFSYALARQQTPSSVLHSLPLDRVWEIHIAGGHIDEASGQRYVDTHSEPVRDEIIELLIEAAGSCENLQCVTYEVGVGLSQEQLERDMLRIENALRGIGWRPRITQPAPVPATADR